MTATRDTRAFHDPLMCLPAAGNVCLQDQLVNLQPDDPHQDPIQARFLRVSQGSSKYIIVYWYTTNGLSWPDTAKVQIYMKQRTLIDAARILWNPFGIAKFKREVASKQYVFQRFVMETSDGKDDIDYLKRFINDFNRNTGSLVE